MDSKGKIHFVFVHGVGKNTWNDEGEPNVFGTRLKDNVRALGLEPSEWVEINWHNTVHGGTAVEESWSEDVSSRGLSVKQLAGLMRGLHGAAVLLPPNAIFLTRVLTKWLAYVTIPAPIVLVFSTLGIASLFYFPVSLFDSYLSRFFSAVTSIFAVISSVLVPYPSVMKNLFLSWLVVVLILATCLLLARLLSEGTVGAISGARQLFSILVRPFVLVVSLLLLPGLIPAILLCVFLSTFVSFTVPMGIAEFPVFFSADGSPTFRTDVWRIGFTFASALIGLLVAFFLLKSVFSKLMQFFDHLNKIIADVVCFMGDPSYRSKLAEVVETRIATIPVAESDTVVLCGHSLGSAILAKNLASKSCNVFNARRVVFLTMGSPLTRLLHRFYPGNWPATETIAGQIRSRCKNFCWINIYRPRDPIGGAIFSNQNNTLIDVACHEKTPRGFMEPHMHYWDSVPVASLAMESIKSAFELSSESLPTNNNQPPKTKHIFDLQLSPRLRKSLAKVTAVFLSLLTATIFIYLSSRVMLGTWGADSQIETLLPNESYVLEQVPVYRYERWVKLARELPPTKEQFCFIVVSAGEGRQNVALRIRDVKKEINGLEWEAVDIPVEFSLATVPAFRSTIEIRRSVDDPTRIEVPKPQRDVKFPAEPISSSNNESGIWFFVQWVFVVTILCSGVLILLALIWSPLISQLYFGQKYQWPVARYISSIFHGVGDAWPSNERFVENFGDHFTPQNVNDQTQTSDSAVNTS
jgi:hypothetical protein